MSSSILPHTTPLMSRKLPEHLQPRKMPIRLSDGYETYAYVYPPVAGALPRLPVLYLHGIQSHPLWFTGSAAALAQAGHAVYQVARRGSGENARDRGHAESARQLLDDVACASRVIREQTGARRLHLLGVSWGGKLAAAHALQGPPQAKPASLTLVAPGLAPRVDVPPATKCLIAAALLLNPRGMFDIPLNDVELFTENPSMQDYLRRDELRLCRATAKFLYASRRLDRLLAAAKPASLTMPTTLLLADRDRIINAKRTVDLLGRLAGPRLKAISFPAAHTLEFEPLPQDIFNAMAEAMKRGE